VKRTAYNEERIKANQPICDHFVTKNLIGQHILSLPRELRADCVYTGYCAVCLEKIRVTATDNPPSVEEIVE
jgi:hypothetical protein